MEQEKFIVKACIHSLNGEIQEVEVLEHGNNNNYIVITKTGVKCTAIQNPFNGLFYADDTYGRLYDLYEQKNLTIEDLRKGYRTITGLNNVNDFTDQGLFEYMLEALEE